MNGRLLYYLGSSFFGFASGILGTVISSPEVGLLMALIFAAGMVWGSLSSYTVEVSK